MYKLSLPYPPSVNHYWRRVGAKTLISRSGRRFREDVIGELAAAGVKPLDGPIAVSIDVYPPDRRRRDLDNILKALFDALEHGGAYHDDSQIVRIEASKREPVDGGVAMVVIREAV